VTLTKNHRKPNGHAGEDDRPGGRGGRKGVNGHGPASTERGGIPGQRDRAASDDDRRVSLALDAGSIHAPGTDCEAYAEVAPLRPNGAPHQAAAKKPDAAANKKPIPGGEFRLPDDPVEFVEEIHRRIDLCEVWQKLLNNSKDPKIQQRAVEKLTEMRYKGAAALADEAQQIVIDIDSAVARRAAEGARK
jgi:hypothetical protein